MRIKPSGVLRDVFPSPNLWDLVPASGRARRAPCLLYPPGALQPLRPPDQHVAPNKGVNHIHHGHEPRPAGLFRPVEGAEEIRLVHVLRRDLGELNAHTLERIARLVKLAQQALRRLDEFWSE